jgi:hypothetical protein
MLHISNSDITIFPFYFSSFHYSKKSRFVSYLSAFCSSSAILSIFLFTALLPFLNLSAFISVEIRVCLKIPSASLQKCFLYFPSLYPNLYLLFHCLFSVLANNCTNSKYFSKFFCDRHPQDNA